MNPKITTLSLQGALSWSHLQPIPDEGRQHAYPEKIQVDPEKTVAQVICDLNLTIDHLGLISINGHWVEPSTQLKEVDVLTLFPKFEGG